MDCARSRYRSTVSFAHETMADFHSPEAPGSVPRRRTTRGDLRSSFGFPIASRRRCRQSAISWLSISISSDKSLGCCTSPWVWDSPRECALDMSHQYDSIMSRKTLPPRRTPSDPFGRTTFSTPDSRPLVGILPDERFSDRTTSGPAHGSSEVLRDRGFDHSPVCHLSARLVIR